MAGNAAMEGEFIKAHLGVNPMIKVNRSEQRKLQLLMIKLKKVYLSRALMYQIKKISRHMIQTMIL